MSYVFSPFTGTLDYYESTAIGSAIGGTSGSVLFVNSSGQLAQDNPALTYASGILNLSVAAGTSVSGVQLKLTAYNSLGIAKSTTVGQEWDAGNLQTRFSIQSPQANGYLRLFESGAWELSSHNGVISLTGSVLQEAQSWGSVRCRPSNAVFPALQLETNASQTGDCFQIFFKGNTTTCFVVDVGGGALARARDTGTTNVYTSLLAGHNSSGTPAAGFGAALAFQMKSSTTENRDSASIVSTWATATDASRKARLVLSAYDTAVREGMRIEADGSNPMIGFLGATAVVRPSAYTQTYSTADKTLGAYTADDESAAYTGIDNAQAGTVYAQVADVNALRVAYENLRAFVEDLAAFSNSQVDDLQSLGLVA